MKNKALMMLALAITCITTLFSSCAKDDDITADKPDTEKQDSVQAPDTYTVIFYGCSDSKLDKSLLYNLSQLLATGKKERVNFAGLVKFSPTQQAARESLRGTRYITLTDQGMTNQKLYESTYRMDNPEHLANFIKETKEKMPADKYILILWDHGSPFGIGDKPVQNSYPELTGSRALIFDESYANVGLSTYELEKAVKDSGTKMDLMYLDVCNNGMIETYYQLKDCAQYIMASMQTTPGLGGNYTQLLNSLQEKETLKDAIKDYVPKCVSTWKTSGIEVGDLECYNMAYMDELASYMTLTTEELTKQRTIYTQGNSNDLSSAQQKRVQWFSTTYNMFIAGGTTTSTDLYSTLTKLALFTMDGKLSSYATQISNAIEKMTMAESSLGLPSNMERISMGITWPTKYFYMLYNLGATLSGYQTAINQSAFMQKTGWGQYLSTCEAPNIFTVNSLISQNVYYYEGTESTYKYNWEVTYTVSSDVQLTEEEQKGLETLNTGFAALMADKQFVLRHGQAIMSEARLYLRNNIYSVPLSLSSNPINICVKLSGEPNDNDTDKDKYQTTFTYIYKPQ